MNQKEIFETKPIFQALMILAIPTIISQLIIMIYNMADTYFIGKTNNPYIIAAASLSYVLFFMLNALANLFGIGGGSLVSRLLGNQRKEDAENVCAFSFYGTIVFTALYCLVIFLFMKPILSLVGASSSTIEYASIYTFWVVVVGGIPSTLSMEMSHFLRSEGRSKEAAIGLGLGSILNIFLDPLFMFVLLPKGMEINGAAMATCLSNVVSLIYYFFAFHKKEEQSILSLSFIKARKGIHFIGQIFSVGFPSAISSILVCVSIMISNSLISNYGDIPVAALGIVKKLEMLPHNVGTGLCQGMIPLVAYNYASNNHERMKQTISLTRKAGLLFTFGCIVLFECLAKPISSLFIQESETLNTTIIFLKIMVLATPLTVCNFHMTFTLQAMGKGKESMILACCRQGLILIPLLFILNLTFGLYGIIWSQFVADGITVIISFILLKIVLKNI